MNPTESEVDEALASICREQQEFHSVGNHNRAIARDRISLYQVRKLEESQMANHAQMFNAVKGGEQYRFQQTTLARRFLRWIKKWSDQL